MERTLHIRHSSFVIRISCVAMFFASGCGYTVGNPFSVNARTVSVPIFQNDTFRRGQEFQLTEAVQKEMQLRGLRIANEPYAQTRLTGRIVNIDKDLAGENGDDDPRTLRMRYAVVLTWEDLRTGQLLREQNINLPPDQVQFISAASFSPEAGQSLATARKEGLDILARSIVNQMEMPW